MKFNKTVTKILASVVLVSMIIPVSGCSKSSEKTAKDKDIVKLKWILPDSKPNVGYDEVLAKANELIREKIDAEVEFEFIDYGSYGEKMNMYNAAGNDYDIAFAGWLMDVTSAANQGAILPLGKYLEEYPELKKSIPDYAWECVTAYGDIYAIPNMQIMANGRAGIIDKDKADKYNFDPAKIKTVEDYEPYWEAVKENEPDIYPVRTTIEMFDYMKDYDKTGSIVCKEDENGKYTAYLKVETPEYRKCIDKMHEYYKRGFIRQDIASVVDETADSNAGKYWMGFETDKPGRKEQWDAMGKPHYVNLINTPIIDSCGTSTVIGRNSKNPEKAMALLNYINTDSEILNLLSFGIEGENYEKIGENQYRFFNTNHDERYEIWTWALGNVFNGLSGADEPADVWQQTIEYNDKARLSRLVGFSIDDSNIRTELAQMETVLKEYAVREKGALDPKDYYDKFLAKMHEAGSDKVVAEYQKQIDKFLSEK